MSTERKWLIGLANSLAKEVYEGYKRARGDCVRYAGEKEILVNMVEELAISHDEMRWELDKIYRDAKRPTVNEDEVLLQQSHEFVNEAYTRGKHDGREASGFIRTMLGRISEDLLLRFDEEG